MEVFAGRFLQWVGQAQARIGKLEILSKRLFPRGRLESITSKFNQSFSVLPSINVSPVRAYPSFKGIHNPVMIRHSVTRLIMLHRTGRLTKQLHISFCVGYKIYESCEWVYCVLIWFWWSDQRSGKMVRAGWGGRDTWQMVGRAHLSGAAAADLLCSQQNPYKTPDTSKTGCKLRWF